MTRRSPFAEYTDSHRQRMNDLMPFCDVCGKRVERMEEERDIAAQVFRFRVYCHGESEECEVAKVTLLDGNIASGRAFVRLRLEETKRLEWKGG